MVPSNKKDKANAFVQAWLKEAFLKTISEFNLAELNSSMFEFFVLWFTWLTVNTSLKW